MSKARWIVIVIVALGLAAWWSTRAERSGEGLAVERAVAPASVPESTAPAMAHGTAPSEAVEVTREEVGLAPPTATAGPDTHRLTGQVVDETRRPVSGAQVELRVEAELLVAGTSAADGSFELAAALGERDGWAQGRVNARDGAGRSGVSFAWLPTARPGELVEVAFDAIVLEPSHALRVRVLGLALPAAGAAVTATAGIMPRTLLEERTCDERGELLLGELPHGAIHVEARLGDRIGRAVAYVPEETEVEIELAPHQVVDVQVVDARTGAGVAGAELAVSEMVPLPMPYGAHHGHRIGTESMTWIENAVPGAHTDDEGGARLVGLHPRGRYSLAVDALGYVRVPASRRESGPRLDPDASPQRVELEPVELRSVSWPIVAGELPPPPDGALELHAMPGTGFIGEVVELPGPARIEAGAVVVEAVKGNARLHALTADGAIAVLRADEGETTGEPVSFRRARRIEVLVRDARGAPVAGAGAIASNQGNNDLGAEVSTDAGGRTVLNGMYGGLVDVSVRAAHGTGAWIEAGSVDLEAGDGLVEATLPQLVHARVRLLVDGEPRLPAKYTVRSQAFAMVVAEDPERGELRVAFHDAKPGDEIVLAVQAVDYVPAVLELTLPADGSDAEAELALERGTRLLVRVVRPASGGVGIRPERFDEAAGAWKAEYLGRYVGPLRYANGPRGSFVFEGLMPGRWRALDHESSTASSEVLVQGGEREVEVELDLATMEFVVGRVELPDPAEMQRVIVRRIGAEPGAYDNTGFHRLPGAPEGEFILADGTFRILAPLDRDSELVAWHPFYVPAPEGGVARVRGGDSDVVLRMVEGPGLRLPVPQIDSGTFERPAVLRIGRYAGEPHGAPLEWHPAPILGGIARCTMPAGRWTLWIDPPGGFAPFVLRDVEVEGLTVLPAPQLDAGAFLNVNVLVDEGEAAPRIYVRARLYGEPSYERSTHSRGEALVQLSGFGPGTFQVDARKIGDSSSPPREITFIGADDQTIELDLR